MPSYREGRDARINGKPRDANPYPSGPARQLWDEGWSDSDAMLRALGEG